MRWALPAWDGSFREIISTAACLPSCLKSPAAANSTVLTIRSTFSAALSVRAARVTALLAPPVERASAVSAAATPVLANRRVNNQQCFFLLSCFWNRVSLCSIVFFATAAPVPPNDTTGPVPVSIPV